MWKVVVSNREFITVENGVREFAEIKMEFTFENLYEVGEFIDTVVNHSEYRDITIIRKVE